MQNTINSDLIRGNINTIILKSLFEGDRYGYDIIKEIEQKSSGQYVLKQPTLYSCLKRLEVQGYIKSYWGAKTAGGRRKYYMLTDLGREVFIKNQTEWEYSRTVIDKLISDREYDMTKIESEFANSDAEVAQSANEQSDSFDESDYNKLEEEDEVDRPIYRTIEDAEKEEDSDIMRIYRNQDDEIISRSEYNETVLNQSKETATNADYIDTQNILNKLFSEQQDDLDTYSYSGKLANEQYDAQARKIEPSFSSSNYFNDNYSETFDESTDCDDEEEPEQENKLEQNVAHIQQESVTENETFSSPLFEPYNQNTSQDDDDYFAQNSFQDLMPESTPQDNNGFISYNSTVSSNGNKDEEMLERDYRKILYTLLKEQTADIPLISAESQNEVAVTTDTASENLPQTAEESTAEIESTNPHNKELVKKLDDIGTSVRELGNNIYIRTHSNDAAKEHSGKYYYYSNRLMLRQCGILFAIMLAMTAFTFLLVRVGLNINNGNIDTFFYISAVLVSAVFPVTSAIMAIKNPDKRKLINYSFKISLKYRLIIFLNCLLVIYCINIYLGMSLSFELEYLCSLLLPSLLCLTLPISALIFHSLFNSGKYSVQ